MASGVKISARRGLLDKHEHVLWFGFLAVFVGVVLVMAVAKGPDLVDVFAVLVALIMAVGGYWIMEHFGNGLVDEVFDHGDYLIIKDRGEQARVDLADIMGIDLFTNADVPHLTLRLERPCKFGMHISFAPAWRWSMNPFKYEVVESLIVRVERARGRDGFRLCR